MQSVRDIRMIAEIPIAAMKVVARKARPIQAGV